MYTWYLVSTWHLVSTLYLISTWYLIRNVGCNRSCCFPFTMTHERKWAKNNTVRGFSRSEDLAELLLPSRAV